MPQCIEMYVAYSVSSEGPFGLFPGVGFSYINVILRNPNPSQHSQDKICS